MKLAELEPVLTQWDKLRGAIQNLLVAQPATMSVRAEQLDAERQAMEQVFRSLILEPLEKHTTTPEVVRRSSWHRADGESTKTSP